MEHAIRFNNKIRADFSKELKKRVNQYFKSNNLSKYGNLNMYLKSIFMVTLYLTPLVVMCTVQISQLWIFLCLWVVMGLGMSGIGLSIMHDANHGVFSKNPTVNKLYSQLTYILGVDKYNWIVQHNVLHHTYTNVYGYDTDINNPLMRFSPDKPWKKGYRFQLFYAPFLYGLMTMYWMFKDFPQRLYFHKLDLMKTYDRGKPAKMVTLMFFSKLIYLTGCLFLPIYFSSFEWYWCILGFAIMHYICGLLLALIFQCAHVLQNTEFAQPDEKTHTIENNWTIHQLATTANFARKSRVFSWLIGGLNFQVEHHLFPNICHVHYRKISKIVEQTAKDFNLQYNEYKTFAGAIISHFSLLNKLGKNAI